MLDNGIINATLKQGTTPIILKVCNEEMDWEFYFRITDKNGSPLKDVRFSTHPPND